MNGVQEVFLYAGANTDKVEEYVSTSRWSPDSRSSPFSIVQFIRVADARSMGDVLRDLDKRAIVDGDFILVHGDLVANIQLDGILEAHRKRREENSANIMTMVLRSGGPNQHRTKLNGITPVFVVDTKTQRCLHYEEMSPLSSDHYAMLDPAIVEELSTDFEVRADLIDAQVDICTPEVLALWSESFDYELPRKNFLHGVLKDWELNGKMIYTEIVSEGYAARASNLQMYDSISRDIIGRWTSPFLPENNLVPGQSYKRHGGATVVDTTAFHAPDATLSKSVIGHKTTIGARCIITNSIIGDNCTISANSIITDSFIWSDVNVAEGSIITRAILADNVTIGERAIVSSGSLLSYGTSVGKLSVVPSNSVISKVAVDGKQVSNEAAVVGSDGVGAAFTNPEMDELDERDPERLQQPLIYSLASYNLSSSSISTLASDVFSDSDDEDGEFGAGGDSSRGRIDSFASDDSVGKLSFHNDAVNGLVDALRAESGDFDSAKLEFMGLRLANNASDEMMRKAVATAFAQRAAELTSAEYGSLEPSKAAEKALTARAGAAKFIDEVGVGGGETEQVEFILALQRGLQSVRVIETPKAGTVLAALLQQLYALDILEEEGILEWWEDERAEATETLAALKEKSRVLVEWLENAEEEDDDEDEDSD